jgi:uncharacterized protein YggU (UPF0235/DUF167 family)
VTLPWRPLADGLEVAVRLTPRASRPGIGGQVVEADGSAWLLARVSAPPEAGKANEALLKLLASRLGVPASACRVAAGAGARRKRVRIEGDRATLTEAVAGLAAQDRAVPA